MNIRPERQRLSIDPYYTPPLCDVIFDPSSPQSSPSPSSFILPQSAVSLRLAMPSTPLSRSQPEWRLCFALCLYDFDPTDPDHLSFEKNEILEIVRKEDSGWWAALRGDEVGWIPSAFVAEISVEDAERLSGVRLELRVCEWEAEKLFSTEPAPAPEPQRTASFSYYKDDWNTSIEPEMKVRQIRQSEPGGYTDKSRSPGRCCGCHELSGRYRCPSPTFTHKFRSSRCILGGLHV